MNPSKVFNAFRTVASAVWWIILILLFALLVNIFTSKMIGRVPTVFGYSIMNIVSGSMEEDIPAGSYILIKRTDAEKIKKDDIICFYSTDPTIYGMPNTHRVVEDPIVTEDGIEFVTKGDANPIKDKETAKSDRVIGIYVKTLDGFTSFLQGLGKSTVLTIMSGILILATAMIAYTSILHKKRTGTNTKSENTEK